MIAQSIPCSYYDQSIKRSKWLVHPFTVFIKKRGGGENCSASWHREVGHSLKSIRYNKLEENVKKISLQIAVTVIGVFAIGLLLPGIADAKSTKKPKVNPNMVSVCHFKGKTGTYRLLSIAASALPAHLAHGDALPGNLVGANYVGADCSVTADNHRNERSSACCCLRMAPCIMPGREYGGKWRIRTG